MSANMVLRTVYLPPALDQELKTAALMDDKSKNDLIRELISVGIEAMRAKNDRRFVELTKKRAVEAKTTSSRRTTVEAAPAKAASTTRAARAKKNVTAVPATR